MHPAILSFSRLRSSSACGCCVASAATAIASSSSARVEARSVFPERNASIALLRTILISHVIGPATEASNPPALCHTFMKASCNTSSARSLLFNIRKATPNRCAQAARYTSSNAARSPSATRGSRAARSSLEGMAEHACASMVYSWGGLGRSRLATAGVCFRPEADISQHKTLSLSAHFTGFYGTDGGISQKRCHLAQAGHTPGFSSRGVTPNPLVGVTLKPWRVELKVMRLAELIADRHPDLRQTLFVEHQVFRDHLIEEEQVGGQRIDLIVRQSPLQPERHAAIDEIPHDRRMRCA